MGYLKKEFFDTSDDIQDVVIHYTCSPLGEAADWSQVQSRSMPAGVQLKTGVGEVAKYGPAAPAVPQVVHPRLRKKVISLPNEVWDPRLGAWTGNYLLHYFYEIIRSDERSFSPVFVDEMRTREVVVLDPLGVIMGSCVNWSVYDWDAPQFSPTEDPEFVARFGEDHPLQQIKFYGTPDQESFAVAKKAIVDTLPLPRRFTAKVSAPVGATVRVRLHVGNWGLPEAQRWEDYWLPNESFVMEREMEPLVLTPLGSEVAAAPLSVVTPDLLIGNPYAPLVAEAQMVATVRQAEAALASPADTTPARELVAIG